MRHDTPAASPIPLLAPDEPAPYSVSNATSLQPLLLLCDHASCRIPAALGSLGLDPAVLRSHLAWDIGAGELTRRLATRLGVTAVLAGYSRLVVDCNRDLADPQAFLEHGDGVDVRGNKDLTAAARALRAEHIYQPYHEAVTAEIDRLCGCGDELPAVVAIHSFTPVLDGRSRPWEIGVLWDRDPRVKDVLIPGLREAGLCVGDNEPYSGRAPEDHTIDHHGEARGLAHAGIEVRQDLVDDSDGIARVAALLEPLLASLAGQAAGTMAGNGAPRQTGGGQGHGHG